jgi:phage-related protein
MRDVSVTMLLLSRLSSGTDAQHLEDCMNQWRDALAICIDADAGSELKIGATDRHLLAEFVSSTAPKQVGESARRYAYTLTFKANPPYFIGTTVSGSASVSGNTTITTNIGDTRETYPTITIPTGITRITISDSVSGKSFTLSGSHASSLIVNCATLQITQAGSNAVSFLTSSPDFGIYHVGSGSLVLSTSNVVGSGTVTVTMAPRYGR